MPDPIKRTEKVHIDELSCKATSTVQWFLENRSPTHPVTHNNELGVFVCGERNQPGNERCQAGGRFAAKDLGEAERRYGRLEEWFACGDCGNIF